MCTCFAKTCLSYVRHCCCAIVAISSLQAILKYLDDRERTCVSTAKPANVGVTASSSGPFLANVTVRSRPLVTAAFYEEVLGRPVRHNNATCTNTKCTNTKCKNTKCTNTKRKNTKCSNANLHNYQKRNCQMLKRQEHKCQLHNCQMHERQMHKCTTNKCQTQKSTNVKYTVPRMRDSFFCGFCRCKMSAFPWSASAAST